MAFKLMTAFGRTRNGMRVLKWPQYATLLGLSAVILIVWQALTMTLGLLLTFKREPVRVTSIGNEWHTRTEYRGNACAKLVTFERGFQKTVFGTPALGVSGSGEEYHRLLSRVEFGFPIPLMYYEVLLIERDGGPNSISLSGGLRFTRASVPGRLSVLPYYVHIGRSVVCLASIFLVLGAWKVLSINRRLKLGLCGRCAYAMSGFQVCPECGAQAVAIQTKAVVPVVHVDEAMSG